MVIFAFVPITGASGFRQNNLNESNRQIITGVIGDGHIGYIAKEIQGAELDSLIEDIDARPDISPLIEYADRLGYKKQNVIAYDITLTINEQSNQYIIKAFSVDIVFIKHRDMSQVHLKVYDFSDKTVAGLVSYIEKYNGFQVINVYQVVNGKVKLIQSIDTEKVSTQCPAGNVVSSVGKGGIAPLSVGTCTACMFACGTFMALGCGLGLLTCVVAPWICLAIFAFCGLLGYLDCATICGAGYVGACP